VSLNLIFHADLSSARAVWWAACALVRLRRTAEALGEVAPPRPLPDTARRGVSLVLKLGRATCLERARIRQAWEAAHGRPATVVIGVTMPSAGFRAHAWLEQPGQTETSPAPFEVLARFARPNDAPES
jgi:hypothetical protein